MIVSLRLNEDDAMLIKKYAEMHNTSMSDLFRQAVLEKIEDEYDLDCAKEAMEDFKKDSTTYTLDEVMEELGLE